MDSLLLLNPVTHCWFRVLTSACLAVLWLWEGTLSVCFLTPTKNFILLIKPQINPEQVTSAFFISYTGRGMLWEVVMWLRPSHWQTETRFHFKLCRMHRDFIYSYTVDKKMSCCFTYSALVLAQNKLFFFMHELYCADVQYFLRQAKQKNLYLYT